MSTTQQQDYKINRREFLQRTGALIPISTLGLSSNASAIVNSTSQEKKITIKNVDSNFEREPLNPYRFKGSAITEAWQVASRLEGESGAASIGLATQNILWSDSKVFAAHSQSGGNALMYAMTERALELLKGSSFTNPMQLLDDMLPEVYAYGKRITNNADLRKTFALNALVSVDNAAWL
ncbi:MAG TPA: hypothetical protein VLJ41_10690, partial [Segetibacter sp.]|nr:hypothetical protein [Segetibacter sp.]